jgi:hypothetical protein
LIVGKGGEYHVIGRLLEKRLEIYSPVADIGGIDAIIRFPNGGTKEVQVKTRTRTANRGEGGRLSRVSIRGDETE